MEAVCACCHVCNRNILGAFLVQEQDGSLDVNLMKEILKIVKINK